MKKVAYFGMMALLCAVACQREAQIEDNPNYNAKTKEVTAEFVLSVSTNNANAETRMTEADVQADGSFRGMDRVHLLTYNLGYVGGKDQDAFLYKVSDESSKATRDYDLSTVLVKNEITATNSSKVLEMSLPLQTNAVLLYGIAPKTKSSDAQGSVTPAGTPQGNSVSSISFTLDSRMGNETAFHQFTDLMGRILTGILRSGRMMETQGQGSTTTEDNRYKFWWPIDDVSSHYPLSDNILDEGKVDESGKYTYHIGSKAWRDYGIAYAHYLENPNDPAYKMGQLEELMGEIYHLITTIQTSGSGTDFKEELRAGSAQAVFRLSADVYSFLLQVENGNATNWKDHVARLVAAEVHKRAKDFFYDATGTGQFQWVPLDTPVTGLKAVVDARIPDRTWAQNYNLITDDFFNRGADQPGFPLNMGLPAGAALMKFQTINNGPLTYEVVYYLDNIPAYGMSDISTTTVPVTNYRYPAELMYWTNSSLRTTDEAVTSADYPKTVSNWDVPNWTNWQAKSRVQSTTRGVAVTKEINYGTALLKSQFKYGGNVIHDNNSGIHTAEQDNVIDVKNNPNQFKVTGLIIGGVDDTVKWNFLPDEDEPSFDKLIYDRFEANDQFYIPATGAVSQANYTMTWDNYKKSEGAQQIPVYIAVELVNNTGKDLWGGLNLVRSGGTFYLVGKLDPKDAAALARLENSNHEIDLSRSNFNYPPYDANGNTINHVRVFMQDYVTEVIFSFNKHSMRNAYVTLPDLRASNVSLGLSVDLKWEKGLYFENVPLGGITEDND